LDRKPSRGWKTPIGADHIKGQEPVKEIFETRDAAAPYRHEDVGADAVSNLVREFLLKRITSHVPK